MSKEKTTGLDVILKELGFFRKFHIVNYALLLFPNFLTGMYGSVFVFEAPDIDYRCEISECEGLGNNSSWLHLAIPQDRNGLSKCYRYGFSSNFTNNNSTCSLDNVYDVFDSAVQQECDSYVYSDEHSSAVKDFDLGCQNWKRTLIGTVHNSGFILSLTLSGIISDRYGRKVAMSIGALCNCVFGLLRSFSVNYYMMVVFEFLETSTGGGTYLSAFVLAMEIVTPKYRVFGHTVISIAYVLGIMSLAALSWALQDWRTLLRVMYGPSCLICSYLWILNESVRWLISKGRNNEAVAILRRAGNMNKIQFSEESIITLDELEKKNLNKAKDDVNQDNAVDNRDETKSSLFMQVIQSKTIRTRVVSCSYLWITCSFVYYGLSINSVSLAGNMYLNFMLVAFVEIPANLCCLSVLDRFGRKKVLVVTYVSSAIFCISLSFLPKQLSWWPLVIYLLGKFAITVAYCSLYVYVSEVFPTNVRQSLLAICSSTGRVGSTLAPLTPLLALYYVNLPSIFFGILAVVASLLVFTMPETVNQPLPDSIEEVERLSREKKKKTVV